MFVTLIPVIVPILVALAYFFCWRLFTRPPFNHWLVCLLLASIGFFIYDWAIIAGIALLVFKFVVFPSKKAPVESK